MTNQKESEENFKGVGNMIKIDDFCSIYDPKKTERFRHSISFNIRSQIKWQNKRASKLYKMIDQIELVGIDIENEGKVIVYARSKEEQLRFTCLAEEYRVDSVERYDNKLEKWVVIKFKNRYSSSNS
jgi:hypothetical protein